MTSYVPNTESERLEMLAAIGKKDISDLFSAIPQEVMMKEPLKIPEGESEITVGQDMSKLAAKMLVSAQSSAGRALTVILSLRWCVTSLPGTNLLPVIPLTRQRLAKGCYRSSLSIKR